MTLDLRGQVPHADPSQPRKPQRSTPYKSDWSPRPIPQPAPERRTADPVTPTLKQLVERERQRTSLLADMSQGRPAFTSVGTAEVESDEESGGSAPDAYESHGSDEV